MCVHQTPSHRGHPHDHLMVATVQVVGSQLAKNVQNSVATVLLQKRPDVPTCPLTAVCDNVGRVSLNTTSIFTAAADGVT